MNSFIGSRLTGARIVAVACAASMLFGTGIASAQQADATALFGDEVLELMLESRLQKPASQATAQELAAAIDELTNIYLITNLPRAVEMAKSPEVKAQIDLQGRAILFNAFANEYLANNQATEQEVFNMYEEQIALAPSNEFKARHILVETQGEAMSLIEELQGGADFITYIKDNYLSDKKPDKELSALKELVKINSIQDILEKVELVFNKDKTLARNVKMYLC